MFDGFAEGLHEFNVDLGGRGLAGWGVGGGEKKIGGVHLLRARQHKFLSTCCRGPKDGINIVSASSCWTLLLLFSLSCCGQLPYVFARTLSSTTSDLTRPDTAPVIRFPKSARTISAGDVAAPWVVPVYCLIDL